MGDKVTPGEVSTPQDVIVTVERLDTATTTATHNNLDQTAAEATERSPSPEPAAAAADAPVIKLPTSSEDPSESEEDTGNAYESSSASNEDYAEVLARFKELVALKETTGSDDEQPAAQLPRRLSSFDLAGIAELISNGSAQRIVCMCGAGISVNAGIPDFRTPGTGLYSRLAEYGLPHPTAVFEIDYFKTNPRPFFHLAKELYPGTYAPTATHHFLKLLDQKGLLLRCYTQNIDSLECIAGLPRSQVIAAHGNFDSARCIECKTEHEVEFVRDAVFSQQPCYCASGKPGCDGLVKPDIVFFGESLPKRFWNYMEKDLPRADLLIVVGTSLVVQPFASLIDKVEEDTPRLLINRERVGEADPVLRSMGYRKGFDFGKTNTRDALFEGDCDSGVWELCKLLGWEEELQQLVDSWEPPEEIVKFKLEAEALAGK